VEHASASFAWNAASFPDRSAYCTGRSPAELKAEPVGSTAREFDALIRAEMEKWGRVVKASGAKAD